MRIKNNDLTHYFLRPHNQLPQGYLDHCQKFFKELRERNKSDQVISRGDSTEAGRRAPDPGLKLQASSSKRQAVPLWKPGLRVKNRFNRKV